MSLEQRGKRGQIRCWKIAEDSSEKLTSKVHLEEPRVFQEGKSGSSKENYWRILKFEIYSSCAISQHILSSYICLHHHREKRLKTCVKKQKPHYLIYIDLL